MLRWFFGNDRGQDLVEYALLTAFVALVGAAAFDIIRTNINVTYTSWDTEVNDLWVPPDPAP